MVSLRTGFADIDMAHNARMSEFYACESMMLTTAVQNSLSYAMEADTDGALAEGEEAEKKGIGTAVKKLMDSIGGKISTAFEALKSFGSSIFTRLKGLGDKVPMIGKTGIATVKAFLTDCQKGIAKMISGKEDSEKILAVIKTRWNSIKTGAGAMKDEAAVKGGVAKEILKEGINKIGGALSFMKNQLQNSGKAAWKFAKSGATGSVGLVSKAFSCAMGVVRFMKDAVVFLFAGKGASKFGGEEGEPAPESWMSEFGAEDDFASAFESDFAGDVFESELDGAEDEFTFAGEELFA